MMEINKIKVLEPSSFKVDFLELCERNRNAKGDTVKDVVAIKRILYCSWDALTQLEISVLLNAIASPFFTIKYPDPQEGIIEKMFEVGSREMPMYANQLPMYGEGESYVWEGFTVNFIEK